MIEKFSFPHDQTHPIQACALEEDSTLRREDKAKKRAIRTVGSYDEFRHRVACAHLTPLWYEGGCVRVSGVAAGMHNRRSIDPSIESTILHLLSTKYNLHVYNGSRQEIDCLGRPKRGWGTAAQRTTPQAATPSSSSSSSSSATPTPAARAPATYDTAAAFEKEWRRREPDGHEARVALLRSAGGAGFVRARLSRGELGPDLLGEMLEALAATGLPTGDGGDGGVDADDVSAWVLDCVEALGDTPRFGLHCALLSPGQRAAGRALVEALAATGLPPAASEDETGERPAGALVLVRKALS